MAIRVVVIEDHVLMRKAVLDQLALHTDIEVVQTASHGDELPRLAREFNPDVVILDLGMSGGHFDPIRAVSNLRRDHPNINILVLTGYDDEVYMRELVKAGVRGYVLKSDDLSSSLARGVRAVHHGQRFYSEEVAEKLFDHIQSGQASPLNEHELAALRLAAQGLNNSRIAEILTVSEKRVRNLFTEIYEKLNLHDDPGSNLRVLAIKRGRELGLIPEE
jgi:DNA-binding NarL/FixJ family response regulator